jgi:neuronal growth regulator 1
MKLLLLFCAFSLTFITGNGEKQQNPSISFISQDQVKDVGGTVELKCSTKFAQNHTTVWAKNGPERSNHIFLSSGRFLVTHNPRFALFFDEASSTYIIKINDIQASDAGVYRCEFVVNNNKITAETRLVVQRAHVGSENMNQTIVRSEGQSVEMKCKTSMKPAPMIVWGRENNVLLPTGDGLKTLDLKDLL